MVRRFRERLQVIFSREGTSGVVLLLSLVAALVMANSNINPFYHAILDWHLGPLSIEGWINDGLMAVFFFAVGLEIKGELTHGVLASRETAIFPVVGAVGGMIVPAVLFSFFNWTDPSSRSGWGIPIATDIAFAIAVLSLFGRRVPHALKVFLLALAIADDLGAVSIIALFYSKTIELLFLALASVLGIILYFILQLKRPSVFKSVWFIMPLGIVFWVLVLNSGVHPTIAGCLFGLMMPNGFIRTERLQGIVNFMVMPLFALSNAGVAMGSVTWKMLVSDPLVSGISYGLFIGKPLGIFGACWLAEAVGFVQPPKGVSRGFIFAAAILGGIGFTMSLFIAKLALSSANAFEIAKLGIVKGSLLSALAGSLCLWWLTRGGESRKQARTQ